MPGYEKQIQLILDMQNKASAEIKKVNRQLDNVKKQSGTATKKLDSNFKKLAGTFTKVAAAAATVYAAFKTIQKGQELAKLAAQAKQTNFAFSVMAKNMGADSKKVIRSLREMSAATVSNLDLVGSATRAMMFEIPVDEMDHLMQIARASATALGTDVKTMFDDIVVGISRQSRMILDNLGIVVNMDKAYKNYAESVGKVSSKLSDAEKKQAFLNAVLKEGDRIIRTVGDAASELTDLEKFQQMTAAVDNLKVAIGERLKPAFLGVSKIITKWVTGLAETIELQNQLRDIMAKGGPETVQDYISAIAGLGLQREKAVEEHRILGYEGSQAVIDAIDQERAMLALMLQSMLRTEHETKKVAEAKAAEEAAEAAQPNWMALQKEQQTKLIDALTALEEQFAAEKFLQMDYDIMKPAQEALLQAVKGMLSAGFTTTDPGMMAVLETFNSWLEDNLPVEIIKTGPAPMGPAPVVPGVSYPGLGAPTPLAPPTFFAEFTAMMQNAMAPVVASLGGLRGGGLRGAAKKGLGALGGGVLDILGGFGKQIQMVMQLLSPITIILDSMMKILGPLINEALAPLFGIFVMLGELLGRFITPAIKVLAWVVDKVAFALKLLLTPIVALIASFEWAGLKLARIIRPRKNPDPGKYGAFVSAAVRDWMDTSAAEAGMDYLGEQENGDLGAGAQYTQARDITININVYTAAMVGDDGFDQFATLIHNRINEMQAVGVL